jgi:hypothetical protein
MKVSAEEAEVLSDPATSLPAFGKLVDQESGETLPFDPFRITRTMQSTIVSYVSDPPQDRFGYTMWLALLKPRQAGASTTGIMAFYPKIAYVPGWTHVTIADHQDRADELHTRQMFCHENWDESIRTEKKQVRETRSLTLTNNSRSQVLSAHGDAVGIGRSISSLLASEIAFWKDAATQWSLMQPALINRKFSRVLEECTPAPLSMPSARHWMDTCKDAARGEGRFLYAFFTYWDSLLNSRVWPDDMVPDAEETKLLEQFAGQGLTLDNLMFRRVVMETDKEVRRNPELFKVYYPFDDSSCWVSTASAVIPTRILESRLPYLMPEKDEYTEFFPPNPSAIYVIGADPAGYGGRDHAAFQVLEVWSGKWRQVASFGGRVDPEIFASKLFEVGIRYNQATIAVERNGVGVGTIALLKSKGYPRLFHDTWTKPGYHKHSDDEMVAVLVDALIGPLEIFGKDTYDQMNSYQSDKTVEQNQRSLLLSGGKEAGSRRPRHHWDKVSAMMMACLCARRQPSRFETVLAPVSEVRMFQDMTYNEQERYIAKVRQTEKRLSAIKRRASRKRR